jgi:sulfur-carrier protein
MKSTVRLEIPGHLRTLAGVDGEVRLEVEGEPTIAAALDALEARYPMLRGTIRDHATARRRAFIRDFACGEDISHRPVDTPLPRAVRRGDDVLRVIGAIAGG